LGSQTAFRRDFVIPIQALRDSDAAKHLQRLSGPFVLRRSKRDPAIVPDLPEKSESIVYCTLTPEQGTLYAAVLRDLETGIDESTGMARRGAILALLSKLKQICNHPAQFAKDRSAPAERSGKLARLEEMLEEVLDVGDRALIFTQFAEMGKLLVRRLSERFGREVLFLHGAVPKAARDEMVNRFQEEHGPSLFVLSLKAGGSGLNLTRASHVFHYDRWWNPAVENQATDRAFRIGQTKNVQVHKLVCAGTLEERIDDLIGRKAAVAESVVGTGEQWLTELSDRELRDLVALAPEAVEG
jgi:SNF2 family DNA or RNA helicase